jgi:hypothetical protein
MSVEDKSAAARTFVRSLNILLKFARLYEFGHTRTAAQFETAWHELSAALAQNKDSGLLLGASGNQILLDGVPAGGGATERSFAQLLSASGIASIHFAPRVTQAQFARFVRAFPTGNAKPSALAEQLKAALGGEQGIRVNEIRYVAEDSTIAGVKVAAQLTAKILGGTSGAMRDILDDPQKLLQMILAAEGSRGGQGGPGGGGGTGTGGSGGGGTGGGGTGVGSGPGGGGGTGWGPGGGSGTGSGGGSGTGGSGGGGTGGGGIGVGSGPGGGGGTGWGPGGGSGTGVGGGTGGPGVGGTGDGTGWGPGGGGTGVGSGAGLSDPALVVSGVEVDPAAGGVPARPGRWLSASAMLRSAMSEKAGAFPSLGGPAGTPPATGFQVAEEDVRGMLSLFAQLGRARKDPEAKLDLPTFQSRLSTMPVRAQFTLQQALAGLAMQAPTEAPDKPLLLKLAEHVAIRFALDSYERGEVRVNAVRQMLERMNQEIDGLRKILASHEEVMAGAGLQVRTFTDLLDQQFWEKVPEENKRQVLASEEAWCVPPRNVRVFLEDLLSRGDLKSVHEILIHYASCIALDKEEARRTTAMGLADLAELYVSGDGGVLMEAIRRVGNQLAVEQEPEIQTLVSAAFVRLSQEAASRRSYPAMQQALASLDAVEAQRPGATRSLRPRIGVEERIPDFIEEALRAHEISDGLTEILQLVPGPALHYVTQRIGHCGFRPDRELLAELAKSLGPDAQASLVTTLQSGPAMEAVETVGLLGHLSPETLEKVLPQRLSQWPRAANDRVVRQIAAFESGVRARLLLAIYDTLDPLIHPFAVDELGTTGDSQCIPKLVAVASAENLSGYLRLKAIEALGRLRAHSATPLLQQILDARRMWHWVYPSELRIAAVQALQHIDPALGMERLAVSGLDRKELVFEPLDLEPDSSCIRQRHYARLKLSRNLSGVTTNLRDNFKMTFPELNLGGGLAACERHLAPGTLLAFKISYGMRSVRAQVIVRGVRPQAIAFEFVEMDLNERGVLRRLLIELGGLVLPGEVSNRSRRHGRGGLSVGRN